MLYLNRINVSEGIDVNKTSASKECHIYHYWDFLNDSFKFQPKVCNRCHDLLIMSMIISIIKRKNLLSHIKIWKEILTFGDIEMKKKNY